MLCMCGVLTIVIYIIADYYKCHVVYIIINWWDVKFIMMILYAYPCAATPNEHVYRQSLV